MTFIADFSRGKMLTVLGAASQGTMFPRETNLGMDRCACILGRFQSVSELHSWEILPDLTLALFHTQPPDFQSLSDNVKICDVSKCQEIRGNEMKWVLVLSGHVWFLITTVEWCGMLSLSSVTILLDMSRCHVMSSLPKAGSLEIRPGPNLDQIHQSTELSAAVSMLNRADFPANGESTSWHAFWTSYNQMALGCMEADGLLEGPSRVREPETNVVMKWMVVANPSVTLESLGPCSLRPKISSSLGVQRNLGANLLDQAHDVQGGLSSARVMSSLIWLGLQIHWRDLRILHGHRDCWRKFNNRGRDNYHNYSASWQMPAVIWQSSIVWRRLKMFEDVWRYFDTLEILRCSSLFFDSTFSKFEVCLQWMYLDRSSSGVATKSSRGEGGSRLLGLRCTCWYESASLRDRWHFCIAEYLFKVVTLPCFAIQF